MFWDKLKLIVSIMKGGKVIMVDVYVALITYKESTIDGVPAHLRPIVLSKLAALGLDGYGNPLQPTNP